MNLFELSARRKYRFPTRKGNATTEDLFGLSLESLDLIASTLDASLIGKTFIGKEPKDKKDLENKLDIVKFIIKSKLDERDTPKDIPKEEYTFL